MKKNFLIVAYACEPNKGSEPEVGWKIVLNLAKKLPESKFFVITKANNKENIEKEIYPQNIKFIYHEPPKFLTFWKKKQRGVRTYYYLWMLTGVLKLKKLGYKFDIIHHITFVNDWLPSLFILLKKQNNKFIWGPIGGNRKINNIFLRDKLAKVKEQIKFAIQNFYRTFDPFFYLCKKNADCIIGINEKVKEKINLPENKCFLVEPAIGIDEEFVKNIECNKSNKEIFYVISIGRLVYIKNFEMTIRAFAKFIEYSEANTYLKIIGDGPEKSRLKKLAKDLNISDRVIFMGKIPREQVFNELKKSDVFLFPSLENAGFVYLEAMSNCLPVVALNYGGAKQFISKNKKYQLVDIKKNYNKMVENLALNILNLYKNRELAYKIGKENRILVLNNFTWDKKIEKYIKIYRKLLDEKS